MAQRKVNRRAFMGSALAAGTVLAVGATAQETKLRASVKMGDIEKLPYAKDALKPSISKRTLDLHFEKHHMGYVGRLKQDISGTMFKDFGIEEIIVRTVGSLENKPIHANAVLAWNHAFYFRSMKPGGGGAPTGRVLTMIKKEYESYDNFANRFFEIAASEVHSWVWLVEDGDAIKIVRTQYVDSPVTKAMAPLACIDMWEHAFYLDYQNRVSDYVNAFTGHLINWDFVHKNLSEPTGAKEGL